MNTRQRLSGSSFGTFLDRLSKSLGAAKRFFAALDALLAQVRKLMQSVAMTVLVVSAGLHALALPMAMPVAGGGAAAGAVLPAPR